MQSENAAVVLRFTPLVPEEEILVRMGMSFISTQQACRNAEEEIPTFDFDAVETSAVSQFEEIMNRIRVDTTNVTEDTLVLFYSSVTLYAKCAETVIPVVDFTAKLHGRKSALEK